jgi:hypothetical protein
VPAVASVQGVRRAVLAVLLAVLATTGCGGGDSDPEPAATPKQAIAGTVAEFWENIEQGDGDAACSAMTEHGRRLFLRWSADGPANEESASCPEAVDALSDAIAGHDRKVTGAGGSFSADDVWIDGDEAEVHCQYRGALMLRRVDGEWLVRIPACYD